MKICTFYILIMSFLLGGCGFKSNSIDQMIKENQKDFAKETEVFNAKILAWENLVDSLYKMADTNQILALDALDNLINNDTSLDRNKISELHFIKGNIYYRIDSLQKAIDEFSTADIEAPKYLAAKSGAYLKLKQYDNAFSDLYKASKINYYYLWNIGNYYEVIGKKDSAIACYNRLYVHDTTVYKFCNERVNELKDLKTKLMTELVFRDRKRTVILMKGVE